MVAPKKLAIELSPIVIAELAEIWRWNDERYGSTHADAYLKFLDERIEGLSTSYLRGTVVPHHHGLRYILALRRSRGSGHLIVYSFDDKRVLVAHVLHSAQDWQSRLAEEAEESDEP